MLSSCWITEFLQYVAEGLQSDVPEWTWFMYRSLRRAVSRLPLFRVFLLQRARPAVSGKYQGRDRNGQSKQNDEGR